ncbi:MAG: MBL fold metallo-hydrolase [Candidatus Sumerlaeaceae bacterium]|nr:MBL fold metallo-hydrolase [Candidatus Sumerlaeaceae bacterium]
MATLSKRYADNADGEFYVDSTCIDCDTCRQVAPRSFIAADGHSLVSAQPKNETEHREAMRAVLCCPTASIGMVGGNAKAALDDFPLLLEDGVHYCGFNSKTSFGGNSYFVHHPGGNWLIDSPRWMPVLVRKFEEAGGISRIFLTHRDDVADADKYAAHFGAQRIIHRDELDSQPGAEHVLDGTAPIQLAPEFLVIPTPGHTSGHCVLLYRDKFLFTGDHFWWSRNKKALSASRDYCWDSWQRQIPSIELLTHYNFEWVLPGHGERKHLPVQKMRKEMEKLATAVKQSNYGK